ncbi:MAG: hypothetical protein ABSD70_00530 [Terracidiphilus sp.]
MSKPGRRTNTPSDEIARFTDRESQQAVFQRYLNSAEEPPVLVFYGVGGSGKTWLLKKLLTEVPGGIPFAYVDFGIAAMGGRFVLDPAVALQSIQQQLGAPAPRFELALAVMRHKKGIEAESGFWADLAAEVVGGFIPGAGTVLKQLGKEARSRLQGTALEKWLASATGTQLQIELRSMTDQQIESEILYYLAADLSEAFPTHLDRAVTCVIFLDTFEAVGAGFQNDEHRRLQEKWIQDFSAELDFALTVIAGQNRLSWDETDPDWASHLDQHLVGGLSESDARLFLAQCDIGSTALQSSILATSKASSGGYHCFSLGLCADVVFNERKEGLEPEAETLHFNPQDREKLARRFLTSLASDAERRWIERLALTPRFDEPAARCAFSQEHSIAQDVAWEGLHDYSFVERNPGSDWSSIRAEMRAALKNQPSAQDRIARDHQWWQEYWSGRSNEATDDAAGLAWYHRYCLAPSDAMEDWEKLTDSARTAVPPRMKEHFFLLQWAEPLGLLDDPPSTPDEAGMLYDFGLELFYASWNRSPNLQRAIACYEAALRVLTEREFSQDWAAIQNNLGNAWNDLPTGDHTANHRKAIACFEAALRVRTEQEFPLEWASTQNNLGNAWSKLPTGDRAASLGKAISFYDAALRVLTEREFSQIWAATQMNLGVAWSELPTGDRAANLSKAIGCYEAALRVFTEQKFPQDWARIQNNLGIAWSELPTGDRAANLENAIDCCEAAQRVYTEQEFPQDWAWTQSNLGNAWSDLPTGDKAANVGKAIACHEGALRLRTEKEFPQEWAATQNNLGTAWAHLPTGNRAANLGKAIACFEAVLRVFTEQDLPQDWAATQNNLGAAWGELPTGDLVVNLQNAIACYEAALRVRSEQEFPQDWATTQNNLGRAWSELPTGDRAANLGEAITCFEAALRIRTEEEFPQDWATTQNDLGFAWSELDTGDRAANLEKAIACFEAALRVYTEQEFPRDWAASQINLGIAWIDLPTGDSAADLGKAIACFEAALRVDTEQDSPQDWAAAQINLGNAWSDLPTGDRTANLEKAVSCYEAALRVYTEAGFPREHQMATENLSFAGAALADEQNGAGNNPE